MTVIPHGQSGLEMGGFDEGVAIESGVDGTEAQNLRFGAAGGGFVHVRTALAQEGIAFIPELASGFGAAEEDLAVALGPVESVAQLPGYGGKLIRRQAAAAGQGLAATHVGPEAAVGESAVRFGASETLGEFAGRDMGDHAEVRVGGAEEMGSIVSIKVASIPGRAEQRGELAGVVAEQMEDGGELLGQEEEAPIGGRLLIAQGIEDAVRGGARGRYAARDPTRVGFVEEVGDLTPAGSFAGLAGFAGQYDEEIEAVTGGAGHAVRRRAGHVAEGGEEMQEVGRGIGFRVQRKTADSKARQAVEGGFGEGGQRGRFFRRRGGLCAQGLLPGEQLLAVLSGTGE